MAGNKGMTHYSYETKREAVRLHCEEGLSYRQIALRLALRKADRIKVWVHQWQQEGEAGLQKESGGGHRKRQTETERVKRLEMENVLLKKYHTELRKAMLVKRSIGSSNTTEEDLP
jgi:transposase